MDQFRPPEDINQASTPQEITPRTAAAAHSGATDTSQEPDELTIGQVIDGRYRVISLLGRGGIGSVYRVEQIQLKKEFALKTLNKLGTSDRTLKRFQVEALAASRLEHPNIIQAVDYGVIQGTQPFLIMGLANGPALDKFLKERGGRLGVAEIFDIFIPVCRAFSYVHKQGVIHRDIKPGNIVLTRSADGETVPKVVDFGIAKLELDNEERGEALTRTGEIFGTPLYMSPEQCLGKKVDSRSDIYSLGCVMFEVLAGTPPFRGENAFSTMMQHGNENKAPTLKEATLGDEFSEAIERVIAKMLAKNPEERYQSCDEVAEHLIWIRDGHGERFHSALTPTATNNKAHASRLIPVLVSCLFLVLITCLGLALKLRKVEQTQHVEESFQSPLSYTQRDVGGYYSKTVDNDRKEFRFASNMQIGNLYWWEGKTLKQEVSRGTVKVPADKPLIFETNFDAFENPLCIRRFRNNELSGVLFLASDTSLDEDINSMLLDVLANRKLTQLVITRTNLSPDATQGLQSLEFLRLLGLSNTNITAEQLLKMKSLRKLKILSISSLDDYGSLLRGLLQGNSIERLSLGGRVTVDDLKMVAGFDRLSTLSLVNLDRIYGEPAGRLRELTKLSGLRRLGISDVLIRDSKESAISHECLNLLSKFKNLKYFSLHGGVLTYPELEALKKALPADCEIATKVTTAKGKKTLDSWFSPLFVPYDEIN